MLLLKKTPGTTKVLLVPGKAQHSKFELRQLHRTGISEVRRSLKPSTLNPKPLNPKPIVACAGWAKNKAKFVFVGAGGRGLGI